MRISRVVYLLATLGGAAVALALVALFNGVAQAQNQVGTMSPAEGVQARKLGATNPAVGLLPLATVAFSPVDIANSGLTGDDRLFIVEQNGAIEIVESDGTVRATPFLSITGRVIGGGEMGLLGLVFDPDYDNNGYFYVNYTHEDTSGDIFTRISRFNVTADPNEADPDSEFILLTVEQPFTNHNGGDLSFGPDGYLYIGLGDGGSGGDPDDRAQDLTDLLGKMLRIDVSGVTSTTNYIIPPDNPFVGVPLARGEIWALGLRNPWRFSFDRLTDDLYIADVGEETWEEVNFQPAASTGGENYGWRCYEGDAPFNTTGCLPPGNYDFPVHAYPHNTPGCAITGGFVYRGSQFPTLQGYYLFADYCFGHIWGLDVNNGWQVAQLGHFNELLLTSFGEDLNGELYLASTSNNTIYRIYAPPPAAYLPLILNQP
ncbi:MAG: PQQ-dependent sugar dehydrogenase [Chloroflexi bacterium]|nr:PQQ-dependent sugar dehydrogenase [Chloroflexota bacterium]MCI0645634.1 PQQ-dependent sugar dehydrogenase [Chloroflexota bacterium]MCI0725546.1 PQQ-dependent sugar dehydrogenase [Chloroflexota bacterium]